MSAGIRQYTCTLAGQSFVIIHRLAALISGSKLLPRHVPSSNGKLDELKLFTNAALLYAADVASLHTGDSNAQLSLAAGCTMIT